MAKPTLKAVLAAIAGGETSPIYLVGGDLVVAEPQAEKIARALAEPAGIAVESRRRPAGLGEILQNLRTFSLFDAAKVILVIDSAIFADRKSAAELIDQAEQALPVGEELDGAGREGASRLLQALRVFGIDAGAEASEVVASLPKWALEGGTTRRKKGRKRTAKMMATLRAGLAKLLEAARAAGLEGYAEGDLAELGEILTNGLPEGHALVLAEHAVAADHPVVQALAAKSALLEVGSVSAGRDGAWQGLRTLTDQLAAETSVSIAGDAASELARRTLRQTGGWGQRGIDAESTARFAGEYRKLASLAGGGQGPPGEGQTQRPPEGRQAKQITRKLVIESVKDRGEEDVWKILDAVGNGRGGEALARYHRLLAAADDVMAARLSFFGLLAGFCRQLTAVGGIAKLHSIPSGISNYNQFKSRWVPRLQAELDNGKNPLAGLHPFRLHRAYMAASRMDRALLARLPALVFETETRIKGESSEPDVAIGQLMARLTGAVKGF